METLKNIIDSHAVFLCLGLVLTFCLEDILLYITIVFLRWHFYLKDRFVLQFFKFYFNVIIYIVERAACPCEPPIRVWSVEVWRKLSGTHVSVFLFFSAVSKAGHRKETTPYHQTISAPRDGDSHLMSWRLQCWEESSKGVTWALRVLLEWFR